MLYTYPIPEVGIVCKVSEHSTANKNVENYALRQPPCRLNSGYFGQLWIRPRSLVSKILMGFCSDGPCEFTGQI